MEKEICKVSISTSFLGDEYTFYENDKIKRVYDNNSLSSDVTEWLEAKQISKQNKDKIIRKCPEEFKERIMLILDYP
ncbi:hypothetical protein SAMN05421846_101497 [Chryseobacterium taeanense]|jgi:hypothetical protein|uniref:Uncharacterized protein n=1 Tax=Chryseobacterium taeanense TaxID=311334 RepID=A0A1G8EAY8_9FLAO|nr:hypothetical protein [Chryseobacterium taeanense]SDH67053.1 hypothetical protein SAMN05421846_101497 [Chryseobacterium taeanense]